MTRTTVGVVRGGTSDEYALSLKTGHAVLNSLPEHQFHARDIFIDREGEWHVNGIPMEPVRAVQNLDVVVHALHGGIGEDGTVTRILERAGVPFAGTRASVSSRIANRFNVHDALQKEGIHTPQAILFLDDTDMHPRDMSRYVFDHFGPPYMVKPATARAGIGARYVPAIVDLPNALGEILANHASVVVEEFLMGDEVCAGVVEDFRGESLYVFPPADIDKPANHRHLTFEHHTEGRVVHHCPSSLSLSDKKAIEEIAREIHRVLALDHFSRISFIMARGRPYVIEVDPFPALYAGAALPSMFDAVGTSLSDFLNHTIRLAQK